MKTGNHLTPAGLVEISQIKEGMNRERRTEDAEEERLTEDAED